MKKIRPFGALDQLGYTFGELGNNFLFAFMEAFFLTFCTYALGISPFFMGTLFLFARLWDAVNDPILGSFPDRWKIGKGTDRFKPYIKLALPPIFIFAICCFIDISSWVSVVKHIWISAAYILYGMSYTALTMPYGSLSNVITSDNLERTKLSRARGLGGLLTAIPMTIAPIFLFNKDTGAVSTTGFFGVAVVFASMTVICYFVLLKCTVERVEIPSSNVKYNFGHVIKTSLKSRPLVGAMVAAFGGMLAITGQTGLGSFLYKEYYGNPQILSIASFLSLPMILILFPIVPVLEKKFGKRKVIVSVTSFGLILSAILFLVPIANPYLYLVLNIFATLGNQLLVMFIWAVVNDCIDYMEYTTSERNTGTVYSIFTFSRKLGSTFAATFSSYALGWVGYQSAAAQQLPGVAGNIRYLCTAIPLISTALIVVGMGVIYNLKKEDSEKINQILKQAKEA
ncbi:MFS transporter [Diplocloster modestus]|uniref:Glycoside-pentoside-hexuronide (GPH):cation symporter n=1 Tax=Diplocloster modestus TaxID=2850322 RepID=A0ABS6K434_9FIRM|nr:glycoside-pentoside-hexuronide (GPH):cation symporter [Diplocloster modestus]MBU9725285.1 glycoside-pentoside-hexuronide (GPH):cation symporter [Diplocloster modestus]